MPSHDLSKQVNPETDVEGYVHVDVIVIDDAIKKSTPYFGMLVLSEEGKENFLAALTLTAGTSEQDVTRLEKEFSISGRSTLSLLKQKRENPDTPLMGARLLQSLSPRSFRI